MYDRKSKLINIKTQLMQRLCNLKFLSDILTQQFTFDLRNFSNTIYVQHYKTTTQQLTTDLCYDKEGLNSQRISHCSLLLTYVAKTDIKLETRFKITEKFISGLFNALRHNIAGAK